ncbi:MAG: universal stress protein [Rhodobacter sp.]|uniref:universal stress protein n=1 Tax=Pararhodobacter sp. TaxID=2127056 RepID=UPI001D8857BE|nr:universal stress protein [Pararhodobacter sp.]MCB1345413.1 universal stress protein [Paracoccaceae bacterium]MCC0074477.1 universal stress protein [Rhodobacter sp.]HPD92575.1 universal stress protein [Pararhodobacter sp.]
MYTRILVPVAYEPGYDISRELQIARALSARDAVVLLVHVMEKVPFYAIDYMPEGWRDELREAIREDLARQAAGLDQAHVAVIEGEPGGALLDFAQAEGVDCIVLASHRSDRTLVGATATRVARHATCAVHLLR